MELKECMQKRRSIRKYMGDAVPEDALREILEAGVLAPSSMNRRPVRFVVVRDKETLKKLSRAKTAGAGHLAKAACAVVVLGDADKSDAWIEDCSCAMAYMLLMAESVGLGACWVQIRLRGRLGGRSAETYVRELLGAPDHYAVEAALALGIPAESRPAHTAEELGYDGVISYERFSE